MQSEVGHQAALTGVLLVLLLCGCGKPPAPDSAKSLLQRRPDRALEQRGEIVVGYGDFWGDMAPLGWESVARPPLDETHPVHVWSKRARAHERNPDAPNQQAKQ